MLSWVQEVQGELCQQDYTSPSGALLPGLGAIRDSVRSPPRCTSATCSHAVLGYSSLPTNQQDLAPVYEVGENLGLNSSVGKMTAIWGNTIIPKPNQLLHSCGDLLLLQQMHVSKQIEARGKTSSPTSGPIKKEPLAYREMQIIFTSANGVLTCLLAHIGGPAAPASRFIVTLPQKISTYGAALSITGRRTRQCRRLPQPSSTRGRGAQDTRFPYGRRCYGDSVLGSTTPYE